MTKKFIICKLEEILLDNTRIFRTTSIQVDNSEYYCIEDAENALENIIGKHKELNWKYTILPIYSYIKY